MPITERQRAHVFRPLRDERPPRFRPRPKNARYLARQQMRPGRIGAQLLSDNLGNLALFTLTPEDFGMAHLTASSLYDHAQMRELYDRIGKCFSGTCYAVAEVGKGYGRGRGRNDARGTLHVHVVGHPTAYTPIFTGVFRRDSERHKSIWSLEGLLAYLQKPPEPYSLEAVNDFRAACVLSDSGLAPRTRRSFSDASRRAWSRAQCTKHKDLNALSTKTPRNEGENMPDNDLKTARATLRKVQARHADLQTLQRDATAEVQALASSSDLDALATAQTRATAAAQLLSKAQLEVDTATTSLRQCELAHTRSQRLSAATDHAAQSAEAREALDAVLAHGSKALEATIREAITAYDGVLEARTAYAALLEGDDLLTAELDRSGIRPATTPDAERGAHVHELGTLAPLIWQAVSRALDDRHTAARAAHAKSRARTREKAIAAARAEREALSAQHRAELAAAQRMREGSETDRARRNNSSFSLDLGGE